MSRVTSLTNMPEEQLNRWIKRLVLLLVVVLIAFVAFYVFDRFRMPAAPLVDQRVAALEERVRTDPTDSVARGQLADAYFAKRRFEDAIVQYTALIDAKKDVYLATLGRANAYRQLVQYEAAIADYNKVVEIGITGEMANVDPSLEGAYFGLGAIALAQGKPAEAIDPLTKAIDIVRTDADALNALGSAYVQSDQADLAIEPLRKAIALVPIGWVEPYSNLASAYQKLGEADMASWAGAMAMLEGGDAHGAETQLKTLLDGDAAVEAMVGLGLIYEKQGETATAGEWYAKALAIDPGSVPAQMGIRRTGGAAVSAAPVASPSEGSN